jgi:hypothetical protein
VRDQPDGQLEIGLEYNRGKNKKQKQIVSHTLMPCERVCLYNLRHRAKLENPVQSSVSWRLASTGFLCVFPFERPSCDLTREIQTVVNHQNSRSFPFFFYLRAKRKRLTDLVARDKRRTFSKKYNRIKVLVCCFHGQPNTTRKPPNVQFPIAGLEGWGNLPSAIILFILFYFIYFIFKNSP